MNRELLASLVLATSLFSSSCAVDDVSLVGKLCPCQREGYLCVAGTYQPEGSCGGGGLYQVGDIRGRFAIGIAAADRMFIAATKPSRPRPSVGVGHSISKSN